LNLALGSGAPCAEAALIHIENFIPSFP
jgi:hypothetical protein